MCFDSDHIPVPEVSALSIDATPDQKMHKTTKAD
jgi:hypothetical protein